MNNSDVHPLLTSSIHSENSNRSTSSEDFQYRTPVLQAELELYAECLRDLSEHSDRTIHTTLWRNSLTRSNWMLAVYLIQAFAFISNNVAVNWFSLDKNWRGKVDANLIFSLNVLFAFGTIVSNFFSKVVEVVDEVDGLKLDASRTGLVTWLSDGPQKTFIKNIADRLFEVTYAEENYDYLLVLTPEDIQLFQSSTTADDRPHTSNQSQPLEYSQSKTNSILGRTLADSLRYLKNQFDKKSGKVLRFALFTREGCLQQLGEKYDSPNARHLVVVSTCMTKQLFINSPENFTLIQVYHGGWMHRLAHTLLTCEWNNFLCTSVKALLASQRWMLSKGLPGLVVLATGIVSFSYIFGAENVTNPVAQAGLFVASTTLTWVGKVHINNRLKGDSIDIELRRLIERLYHHQPLVFQPHYKLAILIAVISVLSVLPYNITTAWFYTADGIDSALRQVNRFTRLNLELPGNLADLITYLAVVASVPIALATNSKPAYNVLAARGDRPAGHHTAQQAHWWLWKCFLVSSFLDGLKCGDNAVRNAQGTLEILIRSYPSLAHFSKTGYALFTVGEIAVFNAAFNIFFSIDRAQQKFEGTMYALPEVRKSLASAFRHWRSGYALLNVNEEMTRQMLDNDSRNTQIDTSLYLEDEISRSNPGT